MLSTICKKAACAANRRTTLERRRALPQDERQADEHAVQRRGRATLYALQVSDLKGLREK
jgi:hypothetical protein